MARVIFLMTHPFMQWKNGADIAALDQARQLRTRGHECELHLVAIRAASDFGAYRETLMTRVDGPPVADGAADREDLVMGGVPLTIWDLAPPLAADPLEGRDQLLTALHARIGDVLRATDPVAVVIPWGDFRLAQIARQHHRRVLLVVQNGETVERGLVAERCKGLDLVTVSSAMASRLEKQIGRTVRVLLSPIEPARVIAADGDRSAIGMVNICGPKGAIVFLNVAANFPDHHFIATGGWRGEAELYAKMAIGLPNVEIIPPTDDMASFYRRVRVLLVPSLWLEAFGRVAIEAQLNAIPVVYTDRCGAKDFVDGIAVRTRPRPAALPTDQYYRDPAFHRDTIQQFLDAVVTLDDDANYQVLSRRARRAGERYVAAQAASVARFERWLT